MAGTTQALAASVQTLSIAATAITTGLLADRWGRRHVLMAALIVGAIGNLLVLVSPTTSVYLLGMAVTGVGLGAVYGSAFGYMSSIVEPRKMASAMGVFVASVMGTTVILTFLGGTLASSNWRLAYVLIPIMCGLSLIITPILLPKIERITSKKLDLPGQILLIIGIVVFLYSLSQFAHSLTSPKTVVPLIVGILFLAGFYVRETRYSGRFYPVKLFKSPVFLAALCAGFIYNFGTAVGFLQATNLWQYVNGLKTSQVALWQLPLMLSGIVAGLAIGRVMSKGLSNRAAILIGGISTAIGFAFLAIFHASKGFLGFLPGLIFVGVGVAVLMSLGAGFWVMSTDEVAAFASVLGIHPVKALKTDRPAVALLVRAPAGALATVARRLGHDGLEASIATTTPTPSAVERRSRSAHPSRPAGDGRSRRPSSSGTASRRRLPSSRSRPRRGA